MLLLSGCGAPSAANIELRKDNQKLQDQVTHLQRQHDADVATIQSYERSRPTVPTLPQERLDKLFTTHGIAFQRITGGDDWDPNQPGDDGLKIGIVPTDEQGEELKAAGSFKVEAFDLGEPEKPLIGTWTFSPEQVRSMFYDHLTLYTYVLRCPWQTRPTHGDLMVKVTFDDELTGREFTATREVHANVPATTTTQP
ncbi:MAG TPA: hypothetical protein VLI90_00915 [Tepidisphaeraceae bacterium]|nr:hypothetical protein [Tepidisphaeraceae bacterium]